jgi:hypothetical protein
MSTNTINPDYNVFVPKHKLPDIKLSDNFKDVSVLGLISDESACGYYRVINPLHILKQHGAKVSLSTTHSIEDFFTHDVILIPRQTSKEIFETITLAGWENRLLIYEIDDDLDHVHPNSPAFFVYHQGSETLKQVHKIIQRCHGMTVTTQALAKWYYQDTRNIGVLPNVIDFSLRDWNCDATWEGNKYKIRPKPAVKRADLDGYITIQYAAGSTHREDFQEVGPALRGVLKNNSNVIFVGYMGTDMFDEFVLKYDLPHKQCVHFTPRHFLDYPTGLHGVDIGIAPLKCTQFNLTKSNLKVLEGHAAGQIMITSNVGPYALFESKHRNSIITVGNRGARSVASFSEAFNHVLKNYDKYKEQVFENKSRIISEYSLEANFQRWPMTWSTIAKNVGQGNVGVPDNLKPENYYLSYKRTGANEPCACGSGVKLKKCCGEAYG